MCLRKYYWVKLFLLYIFSRNKIRRKGRKEGRKANLLEYQGFNQPQFKYNQIWKQPLWMILLKTGHNPYKGLHRNSILRKTVYRYNETTTAKMNSFAGSSQKFSNFSNNYIIVHVCSGCFSYFTFHMLWGDYLEALSFIEKVKTMLSGCFSHASLCRVTVMLVVKFYRNIFYNSRFSNTSRRLFLKLPRNNQLFLI